MTKENNYLTDPKLLSNDLNFMQQTINVLGRIPELIVSSGNNVDYAIDESLAIVGGLVGASRVFVMLDEKEGRYLRNTHEWVNQKIGPSMFSWPLYDYEYDLPSLKNLMAEKEIIFGHTKDMPSDLQHVLNKQSVKTLYLAPLMRDGVRIGLAGFDFCEGECDWNEAYGVILRHMTALVSIAIERKQYHVMRNKLYSINASLSEIAPLLLSDMADNLADNKPLKPVTLLDAERRIIIETLEQYNGNKLKTAKHLGLTWPSLDRRCKKLGIEVKRK